MIIEYALITLLAVSFIVIAYALRQINQIASNAFSFIKADNLEEKIQGDSLNRTLKQIEKIAPPEIKEPPKDPQSREFAEQVIKNRTLKDARGHEWELI